MADSILRRFLRVIFDRDAAKKAEREVQASLETAGKKGGQGFVKELREQYNKAIADLRVKLAKGLIDQKAFKQQATLAAKNFNAGIIKGMEDARKAGNLTDKEYLKLSRTLKRTGDEGMFSGKRISGAFLKAGAAIAAAFTVDRAIRFLKDSITAAIEAEKSVNRLTAALEPLGISYKTVSRQVEGYFDRIQKTTRFTDEDAREAFASLVTSTGDYNKSLKLLDLTANIAEKRNISMAEASKVTAKAALGLSRGMEDLGVVTGTTGDIVGILSRNLDGLAVSAGETTAGKIARMNNLWDEFKEKIGLAIIGSEGFQDSGRGMISVLSDMNDWVEKNSDAITGLTSGVFRLLGNLLKLGVWLNEHLPSLVTLSKLIDKIRGAGKEGPLVAPTVEVGGRKPTRGRTLTKEELQALKEEESRRKALQRQAEREAEALRKRFAESKAELTAEIAALQRLAAVHDQGSEAVTALTQVLNGEAEARRIVKDLTSDQAKELTDLIAIRNQERATVEFLSRSIDIKQQIADLKRLADVQDEGVEAIEAVEEQLRREADIRRAVAGLTGEHADAIARLVQERQKEEAAIKTGQEAASQQQFLKDLAREGDIAVRMEEAHRRGAQAVEELTRELTIEEAVLRSGAIAGSAFAQQVATLAAMNYDAARGFSTPWINAMEILRNEVEGQGTLFAELGQAWAEGGFKGLIALAKGKVKENLARVIEETAKALGALGLGNFTAAADHFASAAKHGVAAAAWRGVAGAGGGGSASGAGAGGSGPVRGGQATSISPSQQEINIYLTGPGFDALNPQVQKVVYGAQELARERFGSNAKIRVRRWP